MFMALSLFNRVIIICVIVAVVIGGWFLYYRERNNFAEYRTATIAAAKAQQDKTDLIAKQQNRITKKAEESYAKDVASIRSVYDGLRKSNGGGSVSSVPDTTSNHAGATAHYVSVAPDLATRCAETTQQVISLQYWINEQQQVNDGR